MTQIESKLEMDITATAHSPKDTAAFIKGGQEIRRFMESRGKLSGSFKVA